MQKTKCTISDLTMDQPWTNRGTTYLGRGTACGQGYESFQLISFFLLQQNFGNNLDFNLDTLDGARIQKQKVLRLWNILGPYSGLFLQYMFRSLGRNLLFLIGLWLWRDWQALNMCRLSCNCVMFFHVPLQTDRKFKNEPQRLKFVTSTIWLFNIAIENPL